MLIEVLRVLVGHHCCSDYYRQCAQIGRIGLFLALTQLLSACAGLSNLSLPPTEPTAGALMVTLGSAGSAWAKGQGLRVRAMNKSGEASIYFFEDNLFQRTPRDFDSTDGAAAVSVLFLPPGEYEVFNFWTPTFDMITFSSRDNLSVRFEIKTGEVTYIGDWRGSRMLTSNFLGRTITSFVVFSVKDELDRDLPIFRKKNPIWTNSVVNKNVLDSRSQLNELISPRAKSLN